MAHQTPLPRFRLDIDSNPERAVSASPNLSQIQDQNQQVQFQTQRSQNRIRRSACSDLQSTTIPEERVYNENRRRASLFVGRQTSNTIDLSKTSTCDREPTEYDYVQLCRLKCQSLYGSLASPTVQSSVPVSPLALSTDSFTAVSDYDVDDDDDDDDDDDEQREQHYKKTQTNNFRHSLPDTSPAGLAIRNFLKRNKTSNYHHHHHQLGLPTHSSQSLNSPTSSSSSSILTNSSSTLSTFRNFLSLVKLPSSSSNKSINSAVASPSLFHSSLTTLTSATGGSSTTLDQTTSTISSRKRPTTTTDTQYQWHFEVSTHTS